MHGIYTYIPETNNVPKEYNVAAILSLLFMLLLLLIFILHLFSFTYLKILCVLFANYEYSLKVLHHSHVLIVCGQQVPHVYCERILSFHTNFTFLALIFRRVYNILKRDNMLCNPCPSICVFVCPSAWKSSVLDGFSWGFMLLSICRKCVRNIQVDQNLTRITSGPVLHKTFVHLYINSLDSSDHEKYFRPRL
jgi:hypothetical protein